MKYLSVCAGIEAASVAWHSLGWEALAFSEIEAFPRAVLAHRYPYVTVHGDFTTLRDEAWIADADLLVGGTPCQAFSVAGKRQSLADDRGNLTLEFVRLADAIDDLRRARGDKPAIVVWENVPGVLSVKDNAFGCFLAALAGSDEPIVPAGGKWTRAGLVAGPERRCAWRVLDAQYFGVAQRRRRVFVVASARDDVHPAEVLFEREGVRRDTPPSREAGQGTAADVGSSLTASGRGVERTDETRGQGPVVAIASTSGVSHCLNAGGMGRQDYETETLIACLTDDTLSVGANQATGFAGDIVAHTLKGEGFDASEDGTGRGTLLVPVAYRTTGNDGVYETGNIVHALTTATDPNSHVIAFSAKDHGADAQDDVAPTMRAMGHADSHANAGGQLALAFDTTQITSPLNRNNPQPGDPCHPLAAGAHAPAIAFDLRGREGGAMPEGPHDTANIRAASGGSSRSYVAQQWAVRRLTPRECERLQGFPDDYTLIPVRGNPAADGPRYKALGNSMAVPVMRWIGERIAKELAR